MNEESGKYRHQELHIPNPHDATGKGAVWRCSTCAEASPKVGCPTGVACVPFLGTVPLPSRGMNYMPSWGGETPLLAPASANLVQRNQ